MTMEAKEDLRKFLLNISFPSKRNVIPHNRPHKFCFVLKYKKENLSPIAALLKFTAYPHADQPVSK